MPAADDVEAIRTLIHRYAELIDLGELDAVAELFAHATWRSSVRDDVLRGTEQVRRAYDAVVLYDGTPCTMHVISNVAVELAADAATATARSYFTVLQARADLPLQPILAGRYHDRFERVDGAWRFADRMITPEFVGNLSRHMVVGSVLEDA
jgi:3-phenylpropionate/cinnamic acid dioxygenase small subunit